MADYSIHGHVAFRMFTFEMSGNEDAVTYSVGNLYYANLEPGISESGENFSCFVADTGSWGTLLSINDICRIHKPDSPSLNHDFVLMQTDQGYSGTTQRTVRFINPTFQLDLPAPRTGSNEIGYFYIDSPYSTVPSSQARRLRFDGACVSSLS